MKKTSYLLLMITCLYCAISKAQIFPVQATTQLVPPYSVYLPDYASGINNQLRVLLLNKDISQPAYKVKLKMTIELNGSVILRTSDFYNPSPITLNPNQPYAVESLELAPYLNSNNIDFIGYSKQEYEQKKGLPEGAYKVCFTAYDYFRPDQVKVSNEACSYYYLSKNDPPFVNLPACGASIQPIVANIPETIIERAGRYLSYSYNFPWNDVNKELWYNFALSTFQFITSGQREQSMVKFWLKEYSNYWNTGSLRNFITVTMGKPYNETITNLWVDKVCGNYFSPLIVPWNYSLPYNHPTNIQIRLNNEIISSGELFVNKTEYLDRTTIKSWTGVYALIHWGMPPDMMPVFHGVLCYMDKTPVPSAAPQTNINFSFTPRHMSSPNSTLSTKYKLEIFEINPLAPNNQLPALANNAVQTMLPIYTDNFTTTNYTYGAGKPPLTVGKQYAWRIQAYDEGGRDWFKNNGYSEVCYFTFGGLPTNQQTPQMEPVQSFEAMPTGERQGRMVWSAAGPYNSYKVRYTKQGGTGNWFEIETDSLNTKVFDLQPNTIYQAQVQGKVGSFYGPYSAIDTFKTHALAPLPQCGVPIDLASGLSTTPLSNAAANAQMNIKVGKFNVILSEITPTSTAGYFTGKGFITNIPYLTAAQTINMHGGSEATTSNEGLQAQFTNVFINENREVTQGTVYAISRPLEEWMYDIQAAYQGGQNTGQPITNDLVPNVLLTVGIKNPILSNVSYNAATHSVSITTTNNVIVTVNLGTLTLPTSIEDNAGNIITVQPNGQIVVAGVRNPNFVANNSLTNLNNWSADKGRVDFFSTTTNKYDFDEWKPSFEGKTFIDGKYERLSGSSNYKVPIKAILPSRVEQIKTVFVPGSTNINKDSIKFVNPKGVFFPILSRNNNEFILQLTGGPQNDAQEIFAVCPNGTANQYSTIGKLLLPSYPNKPYKVILVPVKNATVDTLAVKNKLNQIYGAIGIDFTIVLDNSFRTNVAWDNNNNQKLDISGSGLFSNNYTNEEKKLVFEYKSGKTFDKNTLVFFVVADILTTETDLRGKMPRGRKFGFVFPTGITSDLVSQTICHEIGHGAFNLEHTFSDFLNLPKSTTNNLMDYGNSIEINKFQWDMIHDPAPVWGLTENDEGSRFISNAERLKMQGLIDFIKDNKGNSNVFLSLVNYIESGASPDYIPVTVFNNEKINVYLDYKNDFQSAYVDMAATDEKGFFKFVRWEVDLNDKYHTGFYDNFYAKNGQRFFKIYTRTYKEYELLCEYLGWPLSQQTKDAIKAQFDAKLLAFVGKNANEIDCNLVDVIFEGAPDFVLNSLTDDQKWVFFQSLFSCDVNADGTDEIRAARNLLFSLTPEYLLNKVRTEKDLFISLINKTPFEKIADMSMPIASVLALGYSDADLENLNFYWAYEFFTLNESLGLVTKIKKTNQGYYFFKECAYSYEPASILGHDEGCSVEKIYAYDDLVKLKLGEDDSQTYIVPAFIADRIIELAIKKDNARILSELLNVMFFEFGGGVNWISKAIGKVLKRAWKVLDDAFEAIPSLQNLKNVLGVSVKQIDNISLNQLETIKNTYVKKPNGVVDAYANVATAKVNVNKPLNKTDFSSHSGFDNFQSKIPNGSPSPNQNTSIFMTSSAPTASGVSLPRMNDAEVKLFEEIARLLGAKKGDVGIKIFNEVEGKIKLKTILCPCASCSKVIEQFKNLFPKVKIEIFTQTKTSF